MQKYDRLSDAGLRFQYLASVVRWLAPSPLRQRAMNAIEIECRAVNPPSFLPNASELREWRRVEETRRKSEVAAEGFTSGNEDYVDLTLDSSQPKEERSRKTNDDNDVLDDDVLDDDQPQEMTERPSVPKSVRVRVRGRARVHSEDDEDYEEESTPKPQRQIKTRTVTAPTRKPAKTTKRRADPPADEAAADDVEECEEVDETEYNGPVSKRSVASVCLATQSKTPFTNYQVMLVSWQVIHFLQTVPVYQDIIGHILLVMPYAATDFEYLTQVVQD